MRDVLKIVQQAKQLIILQKAVDDLEAEQVLLSSVICQTDFTNCDGNGMHQLFYFLFKEKHSSIIN